MQSKYFLYTTEALAQAMVDFLSTRYGSPPPYTEVRVSDNNKGFAVSATSWAQTQTDVPAVDLPANFYRTE